MSDQKNKGTLFSSTLKVEEEKVHSFSSSYLPQMMSNQKNKGTLFSSTLKVEEKKVLLFF